MDEILTTGGAVHHKAADASEYTYEHNHVHKHKHKHKHHKEESEMEPVNIFQNPTSGHDGLGMGGVLGGLLLGSLVGRNGFGNSFGGWGGGWGGGCGVGGIEGLNNLQGAIDTNAILSGIADVKAAVPLAEAQVQLALAGVQDTITTQTLEQTLALTQGQTAIQLAQANTLFQLSGQISAGNSNLSNQIRDEGEKTRNLITSNQIAELNRLAAERQDEIIELRNERGRSSDRHGIEISMINNQNQNQLQFQQQQQALNQLGHALFEVGQVAKATNSNVIVGNTGAVGATQTANPTNVRA